MSESEKGPGLLRQGDVLLVPVEGLPGGSTSGQKIERAGGRLVLAEGEATGHAHAIEGPGARLVSVARPRKWAPSVTETYLVVTSPQTLQHEEHDPIPLAEGVYEVRRQREYRPRGFVRVAD